MKEFIFDEYKHCINPNRIPFGNNEFYGEIHTAFYKGDWYVVFMHWQRGYTDKLKPSLDTNKYESERIAIIACIEYLLSSFIWLQKRPFDRDIPSFIPKELKKLLESYKNPQVELF